MKTTTKKLTRQDAAAYLERLQSSVYSAIGKFPEPRSAESFFPDEFIHAWYTKRGGLKEGQTFEEFRTQMRELASEALCLCPTPYEEPGWDRVITDMEAGIVGALTDLAKPVPSDYLFGTLPTGRVNAIALRVPESTFHLILMEDGLFGFANLMCKAVARVFPFGGETSGRLTFSTDKEDCLKSIKSNADICQRFLETIYAYIVGGHPHMARPYLPDGTYDALSTNLRQSM
jgi:hypothetical protein